MKKGKEMGKVHAELELTNAADDFRVKEGKATAKSVRKITLNSLVDTGATMLVLPLAAIKALGLQVVRVVQSRYADGKLRERRIFGPVMVKVFKRVMQTEAAEGAPNMPALLGQIPLEGLDLLVDSKNQCLIVNPESQNQEMALIEM